MAWNSAKLTHPARRKLPQRAALTLAEVLIAMGILLIGLLGVASIFPVGGFYMQSGDIADHGGSIAQAALEDAIIRGHLNPENWIVHDINNASIAGFASRAANPGGFMYLTSGLSPTPASGQRRFLGLRPAIDDAILPATSWGETKPPLAMRSHLFGNAFIIDPIGIASGMHDSEAGTDLVVSPLLSVGLRRFPAFNGAITNPPNSNSQWTPWRAAGIFWPVRRVTVVDQVVAYNSNNSNQEFLRSLAPSREMFTASDDLALTLPDEGDRPARQQWETWFASSSNTSASSRQSAGDYSWIISVAPETSSDRDQIGLRPDAVPVEVSTVVFHKREQVRGASSLIEAERLVNARIVSTAPGGGELLLTRRLDVGVEQDPETSPFEDLREGQYVMVVGPHPLSTVNEPRLALRWCRVLNINDTGQPALDGLTAEDRQLSSDTRVLVAVRGADWPWQAASSLADTTEVSNDLRVAIVPGAIAVHTKTMRLEAGSEWSID